MHPTQRPPAPHSNSVQPRPCPPGVSPHTPRPPCPSAPLAHPSPAPFPSSQAVWAGLPWYARLAVKLLRERSLGARSRWADYLAVLPTSAEVPQQLLPRDD